jgi:hypothetical protein
VNASWCRLDDEHLRCGVPKHDADGRFRIVRDGNHYGLAHGSSYCHFYDNGVQCNRKHLKNREHAHLREWRTTFHPRT